MIDYTKIDYGQATERSMTTYQTPTENKKSLNSDELLKGYFTVALPDNKQKGSKTVRFLPMNEKGDWFVEVKFHVVKLGNKWVKLYDPAQDGLPSPLNDMRNELFERGDKENGKLYYPKTFYICKLIERGKEDEGPKYYRFTKTTDGEGVMDKLMFCIEQLINNGSENKGAIFHPIIGCDVLLNIVYDTKNKTGYYKVNNLITLNSSRLGTDEEINQWLNTETTWKTYFKPKPTEYLLIAASGEEPIYDKNKETYVSKTDYELSRSSNGYNSYTERPLPTPQAKQLNGTNINLSDNHSTENIDVDDLPF